MASIRTFCIRTFDTPLLRKFFARHGVEFSSEALAPDADAKAIARAVADELQQRGRRMASAIEDEIARIEKLATETGEAALDSATLTEDLDLPSPHALALHTFLHDLDGFRRAEEIVFNDTQRGGRQWTAFRAETNLQFSHDEAALDRLKKTMQEQFDTPNIHLEMFERTRPQLPDSADPQSGTADLVQITIYRELRPNAELAFVDGSLSTQVRRPVLEASVTYEPKTGLIECVGRQREDRSEMAALVATTLLGCSPEFRPLQARVYDLSALRRRVGFDREPIDRIEDVSVAMLRLVPIETSAELITVETTRQSDRDIWSVVEERLGPSALDSDYTIQQARIVIRYRSAESNRTRSLPVTITHPNRANLKERTEIERAVANKYLPRWGLVAA